MKKFMLILLMLVLSISVNALDLDDYPDMFIEDGQFNGLLVVGINAPAAHTLAVTNIALGLQKAAVSEYQVCGEDENNGTTQTGCTIHTEINPIPSSVNKFDTEISGFNQNMILVGGACDNAISANLLGNPTECYEGTEEGEGYLKLVEENGHAFLLVYGGSNNDIIATSKVLQDYDNYEFKGTYMVITDYESPLDVEPVESKSLDPEFTLWLEVGEEIIVEDDEIELIEVEEESCRVNIFGHKEWIETDQCKSVEGVKACVLETKDVVTKDYSAQICKLTFGVAEEEPEDAKEPEEQPEEELEEEEPEDADEPEEEPNHECDTSLDCDDNDEDTVDSCTGSPRKCSHETIGCGFFDGHCPYGCNYELDKDCNECNSALECDDGDVSTVDSCEYTPTRCSYKKITECKSGDSYCPENCEFLADEDCNECETESDCDDGNACTVETCSQTPKRCAHQENLGCNNDGLCISQGVRVEKKFCDITNKMLNQKEYKKSCKNNFECISNICIDDECVKKGAFNKFIRWLGKFFTGNLIREY